MMTFYIAYLFHLELLKAHSLLTVLKAIQVDRNYISADTCEYLCLLNKEISQESTEANPTEGKCILNVFIILNI